MEQSCSQQSSSSSSSLGSFSFQRLQKKNEDGTVDGECGSVFGGFRIPRSFLKLSANQKKRSSAYRELLHTYDQFTDRMKSLEKGKSKISSYTY